MKPHLRLTLSGLISDFEQFSISLALEPKGGTLWGNVIDTPIPSVEVVRAFLNHVGTDAWEDMQTDIYNFWVDPNNRMTGNAKLRRAVLAPIGIDGKYSGFPLEAAFTCQGQQAINTGGPTQVSNKITFETDGDLGRVKGGFYLPCPSMSVADGYFDPASGLWSTAYVDDVRGSVVGFCNNLTNQPGLDVDDIRVVVAGGPRHYPNGTQRLAANNYDVLRVNVGRRPDIQRRRGNKRTEARVSDTALTP